MLLPEEFFQRNPGIYNWNGSREDTLPIAFVVELGSSSQPTYESMKLMMNHTSLSYFPKILENGSTVHETWKYHK